MNDLDRNRSVQQVLRITRIIVIALVLGVSVFAGYVLTNRGAVGPRPRPFMTWIAVAFVVINMALSAFIPGMIARRSIKQIAKGQWPPAHLRHRATNVDWSNDDALLAIVYQNMTIVRGALFEGAAFLTWFAYWQERHVVALGMGVGLIALLITCFPLANRVEQWMDHQSRELRELRQLQ